MLTAKNGRLSVGNCSAKVISGSQAASSPSWRLHPLASSALRSRKIIMLAPPRWRDRKQSPPRDGPAKSNATKPSLADCATVRKRLADERGVPAYVIFGDATLREMARRYPATKEALAGIFGVGQRKLQEFGTAFAAEIAAHLQAHPRVEFAARD